MNISQHPTFGNKVMPKSFGRVQRIVIEELTKNKKLTTSELASIAYGRDGDFEKHHIIRAIRGLEMRGFVFNCTRKVGLTQQAMFICGTLIKTNGLY